MNNQRLPTIVSFYMTEKSSQAGLAFKPLADKLSIMLQEQLDLAEKYQFKHWVTKGLAGGRMNGCSQFLEKPDPNIWEEVFIPNRSGYLFPRKDTSAGRAVWLEIKKLPAVDSSEIDDYLEFGHHAFNFHQRQNDTHFGFHIRFSRNIDPPEGWIEITEEYYEENFPSKLNQKYRCDTYKKTDR